MPQLIEKEIIDLPMWSLVLLNGQDGLFSMGGTPVATIREVEKETQDLLNGKKSEKQEITHEELKRSMQLEKRAAEYTPPTDESSSTAWKWLKVRGSDGWWQIRLHGVWVEGTKIEYNQPAILDVRPSTMPHYS